jgi:dsRNA-gated channel SID-1
MNEPCNWLDFFDNHDMWHFLSSLSLFLAFIGLLTIDDDLLFVDRAKIPVF